MKAPHLLRWIITNVYLIANFSYWGIPAFVPELSGTLHRQTLLSTTPAFSAYFDQKVNLTGTIRPSEEEAFQSVKADLLSVSILVLDTSGSMNDLDQGGTTKLQAAKEAVNTLLDMMNVENQSEFGEVHLVGVVQFSDSVTRLVEPTADVEKVKSVVNNLEAEGGTAMPDGLAIAIEQLESVGVASQKFILLMTDGIPNVGLGGNDSLDEEGVRQQVIDLAREAGEKGFCVYTIGFGEPEKIGEMSGDLSIDEEFLRQVSSTAACGQYLSAQNMIELIRVYLKLRHLALGKVLLESQGTISQGEEVLLSDVVVEAGHESLVFTLNWSGSKIDVRIRDPNGNLLDQGSQDVWKITTEKLAILIVQNPISGVWQPLIYGAEIPNGSTTYYALISVRPAIIVPAPLEESVTSPMPSFGSPRVGRWAEAYLFAFFLVFVLVGFFFLLRSSKSPINQLTQSAYLAGVSGVYRGQNIQLGQEVILGRSEQAFLILPQRNISRYHCRIWSDGVNWYIQDLQSQTGTFVNGRPIQQVILQNHDLVQIGENVFHFYLT